jgi:hypothetical protein
MITAVVILIAIIAIAAYLTHTLDKNDEQPTELPYTKEELENIKLAEELYNKDLRPIVAKPAPELNVVEPEFVEKIVKTSKVFPKDATINAEALVEAKENKPEFPIDKPKKKRKYYPKKKK